MNDSHGRAALWIAIGTVVTIVLAVLYVLGLTYRPAYGASIGPQKFVRITTNANGQKVAYLHLDIQQVIGHGPDAAWLGYQSTNTNNNPTPGTVFHLPTNTLVHMTITNFDSQTALRNNFFTLVQGTVGNVEYVNGKAVRVMDPSLTSHTFTIPSLGVSVPMEGIPASGKPAFETMTFSFRTHGRGNFHWQCIVPCGWGTYGFGGPMQEIGFMDGIINVS